jgi:stage II sporulation protein D
MRKRRIFFLLFFFLALLLPIAAAAADTGDADRLRSEAESCLRKGNYREAFAAYRRIAERSPDPDNCALARLRMGDIYGIYMNNGEAALEQYSIVISKFGGSRYAADALYNSGMIFYEKKNYPEALRNLRAFEEISTSGERIIAARIMIDYCLTESRRPMAIRVLVRSDARDVLVRSPGKIECLDQTRKQEKNIADVPPGRAVRFYARGSHMRASGLGETKMTGVLLDPGNNPINVDGKNYRGRIKIMVNSRRGLDVINVADMETYLKGVVPREMNGKWDMEALKAQAVVARTYALYQIEKNSREAFDVCSTTNSQVYGGMDAELQNTSRAVDLTKGIVLLNGNRPALVYYHANSAGRTEDAIDVWSSDIPYLRGRDDQFSLKMTDLKWSCTLSLEAIRSVLGRQNIKVGRISDIEITDLTGSGRVKNIVIRQEGGRELNMGGNQFRTMVDPAMIKSALFVIRKNGKTVRFEGKGAGHGVGMSQWGALVMAREGFGYQDILKFYFPGLEIK